MFSESCGGEALYQGYSLKNIPVSTYASPLLFIRAKTRYEENREFEVHTDTDINYEGKECELEKEDMDLIHIVNTLTSTDEIIDIT